MASTCDVYKHGIKLGSGSAADGSVSITSWVAAGGAPAVARKNVQVVVTEAGTHVGRSFSTRILTDSGAGTLTMKDPCPFVGA